jgi:hypothetical protein
MKKSSISAIVLFVIGMLNVPGVYGAAAWEKIELVEPYKSSPIYDVWGTSDQDLYIVGAKYPEGATHWSGFVCHYNGAGWTEIAGGNSTWLYDMWASSASNIFAVGENNASVGMILHYNGSSWTETTLGNILYGIWGASATNVFAVGVGNYIYHYDGTGWTTMTTPVDNGYSYEKIWGSSGTDVFAVGFYYPTASDESYAILHYDGSTWSLMQAGSGGRLMNVWGSSASDVFAVGYPGILHYNGSTWSVMKSYASMGAYVYSIWGSSSSDVFAGRIDGHVMHYNGTNWTDLEADNINALWNIWGLSGINVYATGNSGTILHYSSNEPLPPSNLVVKASSSTQIVLGWKDNSSNETGFKVDRKAGNCSSTAQWSQIANKAANQTTHTASGLTPNTVYAFRVKAYNSSGDSAYSNCVYARTGLSGTPPSPASLSATSISATAVQLRWKDNSANENGFRIYRKSGSGTWSLIGSAAANVVSYKDPSADGNSSSTSYQYYVCAFNGSGNSPATNTSIVVYQPTNLAASPGSSSGKVSITWTDNSVNETGFEIYRKTDTCGSANTWARVGTVGVNRTSWTDSGQTSGNIYSYRVRAYKKSGTILPAYGYSMWSNCSEAGVP